MASFGAALAGLLGLCLPLVAQEPEVYPGAPAPRSAKPSSRPATPAVPTAPERKPHTAGSERSLLPEGLGAPVDEDLPARATPKSLAEHLGKPAPRAARPPAASAGRGPDVEVLGVASAGGDAFDALLDRLGGLAAFQSLGSVRLTRELRGVDARSRVLFEHEFEHEAVFAPWPGTDTIRWTENLTYGRRGGRAWARSAGVDRPDLEERARAEIATWGLLLRFPFQLADRTRYIVAEEQRVVLLGRAYFLIRVLERSSDRSGPPRPGDLQRHQDRCDVYLDPDSRLPILLEIHRAGLGRRRIALSDYREVVPGGPRLPHERTLLAEDGESASLEIRWVGWR